MKQMPYIRRLMDSSENPFFKDEKKEKILMINFDKGLIPESTTKVECESVKKEKTPNKEVYSENSYMFKPEKNKSPKMSFAKAPEKTKSVWSDPTIFEDKTDFTEEEDKAFRTSFLGEIRGGGTKSSIFEKKRTAQKKACPAKLIFQKFRNSGRLTLFSKVSISIC